MDGQRTSTHEPAAAVAAMKHARETAARYTASGALDAADIPAPPEGIHYTIERARDEAGVRTEVRVLVSTSFAGALDAAGWQWELAEEGAGPRIRQLLDDCEYEQVAEQLEASPPGAVALARYVEHVLGTGPDINTSALATAKWLVRRFGRWFRGEDYAICEGGPHALCALTHWRAFHGDRAACRWLIRKMQVPLAQIANIEQTWYENQDEDREVAYLAWGLVHAGRCGMLRYLHRSAGEPLACGSGRHREKLTEHALCNLGPRAAALVERHTAESPEEAKKAHERAAGSSGA